MKEDQGVAVPATAQKLDSAKRRSVPTVGPLGDRCRRESEAGEAAIISFVNEARLSSDD